MITALHATSVTLRELLNEAFLLDPATALLFEPVGPMKVVLQTPEELDGIAVKGLSMWLYRIDRDAERVNAPPERVSATQLRRPPLPLRLHYLMTPIVDRSLPDGPETEQVIMGKVMQVFYDHPLLSGADLRSDFAGTDLELRVRLESLGVDETSRMFESLNRPLQLAISYEVSVVPIASAFEPGAVAPVREVIPQYGVITGA